MPSIAKFSATASVEARRAPPDPHLIQFRGSAEVVAPSVDAAAGTIRAVSLITADREAAGYGVWIDGKTLDSFLAQLKDRRLKAYATHGPWSKDGTLDEVGYWQSPKIDGLQLREDFVALSAWRKHHADEFDTLFELAEKLPSEFGAPLAFRFTLAWCMPDGKEIPTRRKWRAVGAWDYESYFDPAMPAGALREMPSVRATEVYSADFVDQPAANDGLFRASVDAPAKGNTDHHESPANTYTAMLKELFAKFSANPALLKRATELHLENEKLTFSEIVSKVEAEAKDGELVKLRGEVQTAAADLAKLQTETKSKDAEIVQLKEQAKQQAAEIATFKKTGSAALPTGGGDESGGAASSMTLSEFNKLTPDAKMKFCKAGGRVTE